MKPPAKTTATVPSPIDQLTTVPLEELTQVSGGEGEMGGGEAGGNEFGMSWGGGGAGAMLQSGHSVMT